MVKLLPNTTTTVFIGGPQIYVQELQLPYEIIYGWVHEYQTRIRRAARKMMKLFPPQDPHSTLFVTTKEYITETWKTTFIQSGPIPSPVVFAFRTMKNGHGIWSPVETPGATSVICGGMGSCPVLCHLTDTDWTFRMEQIGLLEAMDWKFPCHLSFEGFGFGACFAQRSRWLIYRKQSRLGKQSRRSENISDITKAMAADH